MPLNLQKPIIYLITSGETTPASTPASEDFQRILVLVRAATAARIPLLQLREKNLTARALYELAARCVEITRGSESRLLVNDRADIARASGADGCHLTTRSLEASVVRSTFGSDFLIGVSTHSLTEARAARDGGADFAVFGPVFATQSKLVYDAPVGTEALRETARTLSPFPIIALGGISRENAPEVLRAGASGVAGISLFSDSTNLTSTLRAINNG
jgi:thiamine-phosphate pyrophosphorylase